MRAVRIRSFGETDVLEVVDTDLPEPGPGQVRIRVTAAALNPVDIMTRSGQHGPMSPDGHLSLGWDVAGTVESAGEDANLVAGMAVIGLSEGLAGFKTHAEQVLLDASAVAPAPKSLDAIHAATLPLNALTASQALDLLGLTAGESVLITGAAGAVGSYAAQLARHSGMTVIGVASARDREHLEAIGVDSFVPRGAPLPSRVVDAVLDTAMVGQAVLDAIRDGGRYVGLLPHLLPASDRDIQVHGVAVRPDGARLAELAALADAGIITTRVAATYPLSSVRRAHERWAEGGLRGRIVLTP